MGGRFLVEPETFAAGTLLTPGRILTLGDSDPDPPATLTVVNAAPHGTRWLVSVKELAHRDATENLRGVALRVSEQELLQVLGAPPAPGPADLVGWSLFDGGRQIGPITGYYRQPAAPVLAVNYNDRERLVPLQPELIDRLDAVAREIHMTLPEGLLEI